jgi:dihydrofolate synthase/folylpolyglutamate synthase
LNYQEILDYLYSALPMFHRVGPAAYNRSLDKTLELLEVLGNPHKRIKTVHIAGTNGKGSVSSLLAAALTHAGYKTGLYTSPHLVDFRERIRINGEPIPKDFIVSWVTQMRPVLDELKPSFFETTVGLCFDYFAQQKIDIAIIETGLGGRIDSTNVITPLLCVITNISWDHADLLGDTLQKIAAEKAGIIKNGVPVISGTRDSEILSVFTTFAAALNSEFIVAPHIWKVSEYNWEGQSAQLELTHYATKRKLKLSSDLLGAYQKENIPTALCALEQIRKYGFLIPESVIVEAFSQVGKLSGLRGRMEMLQTEPIVIADTAHNEAGVRSVIQQIQHLSCSHLHIVWGMVGDKDRSKILPLLPSYATYYFVQPDLPRAFPSADLCAEAIQFGLNGKSYISVHEGYLAALAQASPQDLIYIGGSTFVVGELLQKIGDNS